MGADHDRRPEQAVQFLAAPVPAPERDTEAPAPDQLPVPGLATPLRRSSDELGGSAVEAGTAARLARPHGGSRLDDKVRGPLESAFGADFSNVRVHDDSAAARLSTDVQAKAFTHGNDIYFSRGTFDPASRQGRHLLAHELTHVVQQQQGRDNGGAAGAPTIGKADDPLEAEAEHTAGSVLGALRRQADSRTGHSQVVAEETAR